MYLEKILCGEKTIESRFSRTRKPPFGAAGAGDLLLLKESGGPVRGQASAGRVLFFPQLNPQRIRELASQYGEGIAAEPSYWSRVQWARYGTLIYLQDVVAVNPFWVPKADRRAWVVVGDEELSEWVGSR